jgi:excisionase family DNA binding protein
MVTKKYITIPQLAKLLGISRIAVYKKVKKGQIEAAKIGRTYVITDNNLAKILGGQITDARKNQVDIAVKKTIKEYGELLKLLGKE